MAHCFSAGILSALKRNSLSDRVVRVWRCWVSVPGFATATLLILLLAVAFGYYSPIRYVPLEIAGQSGDHDFPAVVMGQHGRLGHAYDPFLAA